MEPTRANHKHGMPSDGFETGTQTSLMRSWQVILGLVLILAPVAALLLAALVESLQRSPKATLTALAFLAVMVTGVVLVIKGIDDAAGDR